MSDDLQKMLEKLRVEVSRIREQGDIDITRFDWVEHADEIERIAYGIESALSFLPAQSGERNGPLPIDAEYFAMEILFHIDEMYPKMWEGVPNTARTSVRNTIINKLVVLNASVQSSLESLKLEVRKRAWQECEEACMEIILGSLPVMAAVDCDHMAVALDARDRDVRLKARKQAFEEAAAHWPDFSSAIGWECSCGCKVVGMAGWQEHIRSLASAPAVPEKVKR